MSHYYEQNPVYPPPSQTAYPPPGQVYPPPPVEGYPPPAYVAPPPPMGYPIYNGVGYPPQPVEKRDKGDGFWKGCFAALCCCCVLDMCF